METKKQHSSLNNLFENAGDYLETRIDLIKLKAINKSSEVTSALISKFFIILIMIFVISMINIGIAILIGNSLGEMYYGFFIVAGFYLLTALILFAFRRTLLKTPLNNFLIKIMLN